MERTTDALRRIAGELEALGKNETAQVLRYAAQKIERQQEEIATASSLISHITTERDQARARSREEAAELIRSLNSGTGGAR